MMDHQNLRRQQQARSNSIADHELDLGTHHRLKQSIYAPHAPFTDANQYYNIKNRQHTSSIAGRSISPMVNFGGRANEYNVPQRSGSIKYPPEKPVRSHLHASLECLNVVYSDYSQSQSQKQQLQQQQQSNMLMQSQQPFPRYQQHLHSNLQQIQNQHYAASYVLAPAPAETVVNQNNEQDLAAAAMGNGPPQQYNQMIPITNSSNAFMFQHNNHSGQDLFSQRGCNPIAHSPLHRRVSAQGHTSGLSQFAGHPNYSIRHSSLSLAPSTNLIEDKLQQEIKRLLSELKSEKEKNDALSNQLNINTNLMSAFEQSLSALNNRVRQLSTINERKEAEIEELRKQLEYSSSLLPQPLGVVDGRSSRAEEKSSSDAQDADRSVTSGTSESDRHSEQNLLKTIEDLKRQLIEKDRLLTETRLETLSAAHQLEQLESRLNGDQITLVNEDDLDEGVMVVNQSPSDSEAVTDSTNFSEVLNSKTNKANEQQHQHSTKQYHNLDQFGHSDGGLNQHTTPIAHGKNNSFTNITDSNNASSSNSYNSNHSADESSELVTKHLQYQTQQDNRSNHSSSDYQVDEKSFGDNPSQYRLSNEENFDRYNDEESEAMNRLLDTLLVSN